MSIHPPLRLTPLACAVSLLLSTAVHAQDAPPKPDPDPDATPVVNERAVPNTSPDTRTLDTLIVRALRDQAGHDEVYTSNISNVYAGKQEVERYKVTSVGDLFKGLNGVYSGDARNAGALDPNIRGIQGEGRVPVTVDGTEQAMSIWQGPTGVANRNYLDPSLVSSIAVEKGPSLTPGVKSGIGGAVTIRTLEVDDIVRPGQAWGVEVKSDIASNSVAPNERAMSLYGMDYRDVHGAYNSGRHLAIGTNDPNSPLLVAQKGSSTPSFNLEDRAFRIAAAMKHEHVELLAAFSDRRQGNYVSGVRGGDDYVRNEWWNYANYNSLGSRYTGYMANLFKPGYEVTNTSSNMRSVLLKGAVHLPHQQTVRVNLMRNRLEFGEAVPWLTQWGIISSARNDDNDTPYQFQYPYSLVEQDTYGLTYSWKPDAHPWIDLKAGAWKTRNDSARHQNGDSVYSIVGTRSTGQPAWDDYVQCHVMTDPNFMLSPERCALVPSTPPDKIEDPDGRFKIFPGALQVASHDRYGINISNRFNFGERFNLTVAGDLQREDVDGYDYAGKEKLTEYNWGAYHIGPRAGSRREYNVSFNVEWAATDRLVFSAGGRYGNYWSYDEGTARNRREQRPNWENNRPVVAREVTYYRLLGDAENQAYIDSYVDWMTPEIREEFLEFMTEEEIDAMQAESYQWYLERDLINGARYAHESFNVPYANGRMDRSQNPFLNGERDVTATVVNPQGLEGTYQQYLPCVAETCPYIGNGTFIPVAGPVYGEQPADIWELPVRKRASDWAPMLSATWFLTDRARLYARYVESIRFPSLYEATQAAYGYGWGAPTGTALTAERARNWELGYVHDLTGLLPQMRQADIRLNYFHNTIRDAIDRNFDYNIIQFERKLISGIELQSRLDSGRWFGSFGATYRLKNEVCDADYAGTLDPYFGTRYASCVTAGFPNSFMRTSLQPEYSLNLDIGARLLGGRLQIGGRSLYHASAENEDEAKWIAAGYQEVIGFGAAFNWHPVWVFDAYANYRINANVDLDVSATNLANRYYLDPLARVTIPAPGRTLRLGLTVRF